MVITFYCPTGHPLCVNAALAGKRVRCGLCGQTAIVPTPRTGPARRPSTSIRLPIKPPVKPPVKAPTKAPAKSSPLGLSGKTPSNSPSNPQARPTPEMPNRPAAKLPPRIVPSHTAETATDSGTNQQATTEVLQSLPADSTTPDSTTPDSKTPLFDKTDRARPLDSLPMPQEPDMQATTVAKAKALSASPSMALAGLSGILLAGRSGLYRIWAAYKKVPDAIPSEAYKADAADVRQTIQLAAAVVLIAAISLLPIPAMGHMRLWRAPAWAQWVVLLAAIDWAYAIWMATAADWSTMRVMSIVCTVIAGVYAMALGMTLAVPVDHRLLLGLGEVRRAAPAWCALMLALMLGLAWACGRTAGRWQAEKKV